MSSGSRVSTLAFGRVLGSGVRIMVSILVGVLSLAACTSKGAVSDVPHIDNPLNLDAYRGNTCGLLTRQQAQQFGIANPDQMMRQSQCEWSDDGSARTMIVDMTNPVYAGSPGSIAQMYKDRRSAPESFGFFDPTAVRDYPAVFADFPDQRNIGKCKITVGVSDTESFSVWFSAPPDAAVRPFGGDPCVQARTIADAIVLKLKS